MKDDEKKLELEKGAEKMNQEERFQPIVAIPTWDDDLDDRFQRMRFPSEEEGLKVFDVAGGGNVAEERVTSTTGGEEGAQEAGRPQGRALDFGGDVAAGGDFATPFDALEGPEALTRAQRVAAEERVTSSGGEKSTTWRDEEGEKEALEEGRPQGRAERFGGDVAATGDFTTPFDALEGPEALTLAQRVAAEERGTSSGGEKSTTWREEGRKEGEKGVGAQGRFGTNLVGSGHFATTLDVTAAHVLSPFATSGEHEGRPVPDAFATTRTGRGTSSRDDERGYAAERSRSVDDTAADFLWGASTRRRDVDADLFQSAASLAEEGFETVKDARARLRPDAATLDRNLVDPRVVADLFDVVDAHEAREPTAARANSRRPLRDESGDSVGGGGDAWEESATARTLGAIERLLKESRDALVTLARNGTGDWRLTLE